MDDLNAMINQIMSDPESMKQLQSVAASLGLGGDTIPAQPPPPAQNPAPDLSSLASLLSGLSPPPAPPPAQTPDLSALSGLLSGLSSQPAPAPAPPAGNVDLSALSGLLGNLRGGNKQNPADGNLSALTSLLGGGAGQQAAPGPLPGIDISTIMKLSQAFSSMQSNRANVDLLLALKPRLKADRSKKVDDAIRVMQLIQFLPLIKESGLFGEMDKILGGFTGNNSGGLGGLLGNVGNGIGGLLGGLGRR